MLANFHSSACAKIAPADPAAYSAQAALDVCRAHVPHPPPPTTAPGSPSCERRWTAQVEACCTVWLPGLPKPSGNWRASASDWQAHLRSFSSHSCPSRCEISMAPVEFALSHIGTAEAIDALGRPLEQGNYRRNMPTLFSPKCTGLLIPFRPAVPFRKSAKWRVRN